MLCFIPCQNRPLTDTNTKFVVYDNKSYHKECFTCHGCGKSLQGEQSVWKMTRKSARNVNETRRTNLITVFLVVYTVKMYSRGLSLNTDLFRWNFLLKVWERNTRVICTRTSLHCFSLQKANVKMKLHWTSSN